MYNSNKKNHYFFTDSLSLYRALSVTSMNSLGSTLAFGGFYRVVFAPSNFLNKTITSGAKQNNVRNIVSAAVHESVHCYLTKGAILLNRVRMPLWIEEGVCEYLAKDSSYNIHQGMENILNEVTDPAKSFDYFVWRTAVVYLIEIKGLTLDDVLKYKGKPAPVISEFKIWYQNSETEQKTQFISLLE